MTEKQRKQFEKFGARVMRVSSEGSITFECDDLNLFMKKAYGLKPMTSYTAKTNTYTVFFKPDFYR